VRHAGARVAGSSGDGDAGANGNDRPGRARNTQKVTGTMRMMKTLSMAGTLFSRTGNSFLNQMESTWAGWLACCGGGGVGWSGVGYRGALGETNAHSAQ